MTIFPAARHGHGRECARLALESFVRPFLAKGEGIPEMARRTAESGPRMSPAGVLVGLHVAGHAPLRALPCAVRAAADSARALRFASRGHEESEESSEEGRDERGG